MNEFDFIKTLQLDKKPSHTSIGDDAVLYNGALIAKDIMCEGVHFLSTTPIEHVVHKLFSSNVSDIASMGGIATACLIGVAVPKGYDLQTLSDSIKKYCKFYELELIGGDTTSSFGGLMLSMTVIGTPQANVLTRSGAKAGDLVYVSRKLGSAKMSLECELGTHQHNIDKYKHYSLNAETKLGALLGSIDCITACTDISDGLGIDLGNIATSSNVKIVLDSDKLTDASVFNIDYAIQSGEEYALVFCVQDYMAEELERYIFRVLSKEIFCIGRVFDGKNVYLSQGKSLINITNQGYEHKF